MALMFLAAVDFCRQKVLDLEPAWLSQNPEGICDKGSGLSPNPNTWNAFMPNWIYQKRRPFSLISRL